MKKTLFLLIILVLVSSNSLLAQPDEDDIIYWDNYPLSIGIYMGYKAGVSFVDPPEGRQNAIAFNGLPDVGLSVMIPVSQTSMQAFQLDLGFSNFSYYMKDYHSEDKYKHSFSYFTITPGYFFSGLLAGFNFGFPISADYDKNKIDADKVDFMASVYLGGMFPIFKDTDGRLNIFIKAEYFFTGMYKDFRKNDPMIPVIPPMTGYPLNDLHNPRVVSLQLGFNYLIHF